MSAGPEPGEGRRHRRRLPALLRHPARLAAASLGLFAAAVLGVRFGQSAISEINPVHFRGPIERPRAIDPPPEPAPFDPYAASEAWTTAAGPPGAPGCGSDCGEGEARAAMRVTLAGQDRPPAALLPAWRDATPQTELAPWPPGQVRGRGAGVERYLHYPVNQEQAARAQPRPAAAEPARPAAALAPPPTPTASE